MFKVNTTKLNTLPIDPLLSYSFKIFNPLYTKDYIFLNSNSDSEFSNDYELLFELNNLKYYKLNLVESYSNITVLEINNYKFNLTENINQIGAFEFYYNPIENYIIFVI